MGSTAIDELKAQIATKEAEFERVRDEVAILRRALAIVSGKRSDEVRVSGPRRGQTLLDTIVEILGETGHPLSADELVSKAKTKGSQASRQTILGAAYRAAKTKEGQKIRVIDKGIFALVDVPWAIENQENERKVALA
jgi:hypothetical protein